ncbi:MAG TPA: hypothetical protein EYP48_03215 [Ignisphaera sp.]|uniref:Uncharacterized protein n=1 Tax=Ignisphaera aggregans TaxID=334771 RepID=A0A832YYZ2_9CREN|nr:hypothetical protein [Ignisphaera sp.]HIP57506.1 hypothetical protein [Ignisphaera aggregans]
MALPFLAGIASTTLLPVIEGLESVINRATKLGGRDLVADLRYVVDPVIEYVVAKLLNLDRAEGKNVMRYVYRVKTPLQNYITAVSMRIVARALKNQISFSDLRAFCREVVYSAGRRVMSLGHSLGLALAALADLDIEILTLLPVMGIKNFVYRVTRHANEEYMSAVDLASQLAAISITILRAYVTNPQKVQRVYSSCEDMVEKLVDDLEAYLDTIALLLNEDNKEALSSLPGVKHG